jgi:3-hydroxyisobutyrate dehydrogenase-like beta-hydroxyacid dehydrogenase
VKVAFIGLGRMGFPIAGHLARAGHDVVVYNRSPVRLAAWLAEHPGAPAATPAEAAAEAELVFVCVTDANAGRAVLMGDDGAFSGMRPGAVLIDHSSATPDFARELSATAAERGLRFLDAPVTGGTQGAAAGALGVMVGGDAATFALALPAMRAYGRTVSLMGPVGSGHLAKLVNVVCAVGMTQALAEGLAFAKRAGLDMDRLLDVLMAGSTRSYLLEHKGPAMVAAAHSPALFTVDLVRKDIGQAVSEAARVEARIPVLAMVDRFYADIQARGGGAWDTSSLITLLE